MPGAMEPEAVGAGDTPPVELPVDDTPPRLYVVFAQSVDLDIDFAEKRVHGRSDIMIVPTDNDNTVSEVFIDARQCEIDVSQIRVSNCEVEASYQDPCELAGTPKNYRWSAPQWMIRKHRMEPLLHHRRKEVSAVNHDLKCCTPFNGSIRVKLPSVEEVLRKNRDSQKADQQALLLHSDGTIGGYRVSIPFKLKNDTDGLQFVGVNETDTRYPHVYSRHSIEPGTASSIFPCIDDPGSRNNWKISITCPRTLGDAYHEPSTPQPQSNTNGSRKRKLGEEEPHRRQISLTEEDKQLEMTVVCSGYLTGEVINKDDETKKTMTFEVERNKAAKHIGFAVGPFEHVDLWSEFRSEEDDAKLNRSVVKVHGYCLPGRAEEVRNTCSTLVTAIDYLILTFGAYPFESYKVCFVDDMIEDAVPLCAFSLCSTRLLYPANVIDTEVEVTRTLVHSLACQWFGINIIPNTKADIWLVTGLAWFLTDHFMKALCGNNEFRFRMKTMSDKLVETDIKRPSLHDLGETLYLGSFEVDFMNLKAPLVLFILDRRLSKSTSTTGISRIISRMVTKANTSAQATDDILGSDAFRRACEKTCNSRLEHFWNQWVLMSGCPRFVVHQRFNKKRLCVEMTISQKQDIAFIRPRQLKKEEFWRAVMEEDHAVLLAEPQSSFTGPMTIRIHEADGTPYEHIVEIREDSAKSVKFEIPYNTKYKRLKRNRRQRERAVASSNARGDEDGQKTLYYLGDVMQQPDDMEEWDFRDWDEETEQKMDQESYEWIRMDADFEWICDMQTNLPAYMYASQLQQDRDVVAQQDSMLFLNRSFNKTGPHPLVSTILTRTLLDPRYYYGIRIMAAEELPRHAANEHVNWIGLRHLLRVFQHFFCHPGTYIPRPNDFSDKRQYLVQRVIPEAIARVRGEDGRCPKEGRRFILEQLQNNDNKDNIYSDQQYICCLIKALATCQLVDAKKVKQQPKTMSFSFGDGDEDEVMEEAVDPEPEEFRDLAYEEIERYRRMDEYSPSYQNCFTTAALDAFCRLMKAKIIPTNHIIFVQYLQDKTYDLVRIKACQCLVELGMLSRPSFMRFLFLLVSTDPSPFVRHHLFEALCHGLASIAIGENEPEKQAPERPTGDELIIEQNSDIMEARKKAKARKENLAAARAALKKETTDDENLQTAIWTAMESPILSVAERVNLLELCSILFEEDQSLLLSFKYPSYWTAERGEKGRHRCLVKFKRHYRVKPRKTYATQPLPPKPEPKRTITLNLNRSMSISAKPPTPATTQAPPLPAAPTPKPLDPVPAPKSAAPTQKQTSTPKERPAAPIIKLPSMQEPKDKAGPKQVVKQSAIAVASRGATPSGSLEKSKQEKSKQEKSKADKSNRDSISVQAPVRPTIEVPQAEPRAATPKANGNGNLMAKLPRPPKRASSEHDSPRPTKIVKLDTSSIPRKKLEKLGKRPKRRLLRTVKFTAWHKLRLRKDKDSTAQAGSIRATPKHRKPEDRLGKVGKSGLSSPRPSVAPSSPAHRAIDSSQRMASPSGPSGSQNTINTTPTSSTLSQHSSQPGSDGKVRKPLPGMRKPLPMGGSTSNPSPSKTQSQQSQGHHSSAPASSPPPSKGAPTKLKIKLKPSASGSSKN
ncbi:hypothetical protein F4821DRAFT_234479 [Hypoxylon rubiginosum]|uniref:Uncharacterized protein n=1 Tax=Hypoxylon rubiginosum TaxID=110542 RepID=A0ACC0D5N3_9PEZI|nr:hypothetical protein F4821DRAFT_234479 [Hypoxylon rubiginosum]